VTHGRKSAKSTVCGRLGRLLNTRSGKRRKKEEGRRKKEEGRGKNYPDSILLFFKVYFLFPISPFTSNVAKLRLLLVRKSDDS
jgi:hypothetical protein